MYTNLRFTHIKFIEGAGNDFPKVLISESDINTLHMIQIALSAEGFATMSTCDRDIIEDLELFQPNLLILEWDPLLQPSDRFLYQLIYSKASLNEVLIVLLCWNEDFKNNLVVCNADGYIIKPLDYTDVCNTVKDLLSI